MEKPDLENIQADELVAPIQDMVNTLRVFEKAEQIISFLAGSRRLVREASEAKKRSVGRLKS